MSILFHPGLKAPLNPDHAVAEIHTQMEKTRSSPRIFLPITDILVVLLFSPFYFFMISPEISTRFLEAQLVPLYSFISNSPGLLIFVTFANVCAPNVLMYLRPSDANEKLGWLLAFCGWLVWPTLVPLGVSVSTVTILCTILNSVAIASALLWEEEIATMLSWRKAIERISDICLWRIGLQFLGALWTVPVLNLLGRMIWPYTLFHVLALVFMMTGVVAVGSRMWHKSTLQTFFRSGWQKRGLRGWDSEMISWIVEEWTDRDTVKPGNLLTAGISTCIVFAFLCSRQVPTWDELIAYGYLTAISLWTFGRCGYMLVKEQMEKRKAATEEEQKIAYYLETHVEILINRVADLEAAVEKQEAILKENKKRQAENRAQAVCETCESKAVKDEVENGEYVVVDFDSDAC